MRVLGDLFDIDEGYLFWPHILAAEAKAAWERRKEALPALVAAGTCTEAEAKAQIAAWAAIAKDWRWINVAEGQPATTASLPARLEVLESTTAEIRKQIDAGAAQPNPTRDRWSAIIALHHWAEVEAQAYRTGTPLPTNHPRQSAPARHTFHALTKSSPSTRDGEGDRREAGVVGQTSEREAA